MMMMNVIEMTKSQESEHLSNGNDDNDNDCNDDDEVDNAHQPQERDE